MTPAALVHSLRRRGFRLRLVDGKIGVTPFRWLGTDDRADLTRLRSEVIEHLTAESRFDVPAGWTAEAWAERLRYLSSLSAEVDPMKSKELAEWASGVERYRVESALDRSNCGVVREPDKDSNERGTGKQGDSANSVQGSLMLAKETIERSGGHSDEEV